MRPQFIHLCLLLAMLGTGLNLVGCQQPPYHLDTRYHAANQESRIQYLVVHYTQIDDAQSLYELTRRDSGVSAHYLISQAAIPEYQVRWRWEPGSIAIWDNRATQHYAVMDYPPSHRKMERAGIIGTPTF